MKHWQEIRKRAFEIRAELFPNIESNNTLLDGEEILNRLDVLTGIEREKAKSTNPALQNSHAIINADYFTLIYNGDLPAWFAIYCQTHEYAHYFLHGGVSHCSAEDISLRFDETDVPTGENRVIGYSSRERREREADLFAREMLLPSGLLRRLFIEENWRARDFKRITGLPFDFICQQLAHALLISDAIDVVDNEKIIENDATSPTNYALDENQRIAAHSDEKRLLIEAGPGTGKTRALVGRVLYLLEKNVAPESILALTFSNKAAEEMRTRIAKYAPEAASKIWLGTFHAFGLEVLRKFANDAELPPHFQFLDSIDSQILLEKNLLALELKHYKSLHAPTSNLKSLLNGISRAKDELVDVENYERAAKDLFDKAQSEVEILVAEKTLEVANVYRFYDKLLRENGWLDFGDLLFRAVKLLRTNDVAKKHWQAKYSHILVDEFQDVNRASGVLLREIAGQNGNLWVVGDARQTIYRWRGASTTNLQAFAKDFPDAITHSLTINYRSEIPVINLLNELAPNVTMSENFKGWRTPENISNDVNDSQKSKIRYIEADELTTETRFIGDEIMRQNECGLTFRNQAILGRTNNILAKVADDLTRREIPILYLGNMFEREEIRDLLSLLSLTSPNRGRHLLRLTRIPEYDFDTTQIRRLIALADKTGKQFPDALNLAETDAEIVGETRDKITLLKNQFAEIDEKTTAWRFFSSYLFDRSDYLSAILRDDSVNGRQKRFAIYQLLQFAIAETTKNEAVRIEEVNPRKSFLRLVKHLATSGEEAAFRRLPSWAESIDAVRLLTIHAAKGLEFPTVFMPYMGNAYFPNKKRIDNCPLPKSLLNEQFEEGNAHEAEELCLFFVAASRAKNHLIFSRAKNYGSSSKASRFLDLLPQNLPAIEAFESVKVFDEISAQTVTNSALGEHSNFYTFNELKTYHNCPRQYFYENVLQLRGSHDEAIFLQFHACVQSVIYWAKNLRAANKTLELEIAFAKLDEIWLTKPLHSHGYAPMYLDEARKLVERAVVFFSNQTPTRKVSDDNNKRLEFSINGERIIATADLLEISSEGLTVSAQKIKTGRAKKEIKDLSPDDLLSIAALHQAVTETFPNAQVNVAFNYLASGDILEYNPKNIKTQLKHLESSVSGIRQRIFTTKADSQKCPSCAHYFICPGGDL